MSATTQPLGHEIPVYDPEYHGEQLALFGQVVIDDSVILEGSEAIIGARLDTTPIEIFKYGSGTLEVYPLDGGNDPIVIDTFWLDEFNEAHVRGLIQTAYQLRALKPIKD